MDVRKLTADIAAGLTVSFAAISLGAAFGVMSGRGAFAGMIGAAVIPIITSIFGGTRIQASGPTAPMTVVSALTIAFAYDHFPDKVLAEQFITLVFIMNAIFLAIVGIIGLGKYIKLIPNVVILGFMNGIAVLIWADQFKKLVGIDSDKIKGGMGMNLAVAISTFALIFIITWAVKKLKIKPSLKSFISGVLWSIILMTIFSSLINLNIEHVTLGTSISSFGEFGNMIIRYFPSSEIFTTEYVLMAAKFGAELMLLAYLDSLLTALVVDKMTKEKSKLNKELIAQGLANATSAILQGIPGAQATMRSVLLVKEGAETRIAGILLGVFAFIILILIKDLLALVPAAVFMGVLLKAGLDVADKDFLLMYFKRKWKQSRERNIQLLFILYTTIITVLVDLNTAVVSGTILYYISRYFFKTKDVEEELTEVGEEDQKLVTN